MKRLFLYIEIIFYLAAGLNHFRVPDKYFGIIPPYLPWYATINICAGVAEIILAMGLMFQSTRKPASYGIILMLFFFLPAHIYFIQMKSCIPGLCFPEWVGWFRLVFIHPLLILWAWWVSGYRPNNSRNS